MPNGLKAESDVHIVGDTQGGVHSDVYPKRVFVRRRVRSCHVDDGVAVGERSIDKGLVLCSVILASGGYVHACQGREIELACAIKANKGTYQPCSKRST